MWGFQAWNAAPIVDGHVIANPETVATAIRIGSPASWEGAKAARDDSGGLIDKVTDDDILDAYRFLAAKVFSYPSEVSKCLLSPVAWESPSVFLPLVVP